MLGRGTGSSTRRPTRSGSCAGPGLVVADALEPSGRRCARASPPAELDADRARRASARAGAVPSFLGYGQARRIPATLCISVNDEVVHGIPGPRVLAAGDVVSVDCGAILAGWHGDAAFTAVVAAPAGRRPSTPRDRGPGRRSPSSRCGTGSPRSAAGERLRRRRAAPSRTTSADRLRASSRTTAATASAPRCTRTRTCSNYRTRDKGPRMRAGPVRGDRADADRRRPGDPELADGWTVATRRRRPGRALGALGRPDDGGLWVLTARDGGAAGARRRSASRSPRSAD